MRKASTPPGHGDKALNASGRMDGYGDTDITRDVTKRIPAKASNQPSPPPPSKLKAPPVASLSSTISSDDDFAMSFDPEFLRQQEAILATLQSNNSHTKQTPNPPPPTFVMDDHSYQKRSITTSVTPSPPKARPRYVYRGRNDSHLSHESSAASSHNTGSTAPSTSPPSSCYSSGVSTDSGSFFYQSEVHARKPPATSYPDVHDQDVHFETDIAACLEDVKLIREQQRILEQIQRGNATTTNREEVSTARRNGNMAEYVDYSTAQPDRQVARLAAATISENASISQRSPAMAPTSSSRNRDTADMSEKQKSSKSDSSRHSHRHHLVEDQSFQVGNKNLRVQGTSKTYDAISRGQAIIVQCASCKSIMQVGATAKLLYCSICENVTPVKLAQEQQVVDPRQGLLSNYCQQDLDARISRAIQNQEKDVALARKLAKTSN